jgi:hypothetical protein
VKQLQVTKSWGSLKAEVEACRVCVSAFDVIPANAKQNCLAQVPNSIAGLKCSFANLSDSTQAAHPRVF